MTNSPDHVEGASTLTEVIAQLDAEGYTEEFSLEGSEVKCGCGCDNTFVPADAENVTLRRLEGASDPADNELVVGLGCPCCDAKGRIVVNYGPNASADEADFLRALPSEED